MRKLRMGLLCLGGFLWLHGAHAQTTFPTNGVADPRTGYYAFTHGTLVKDAAVTLTDATLVIRNGRIVSVGSGAAVPAGAVEVNCKGKYIYPSFIDAYSDYGTVAPQRVAGFSFSAPAQLATATKGAYAWNQALKAEQAAHAVFTADEAKAKTLRDAGFGTVLTHIKDGIARGTGALVTLGNEKENLSLLKDKASAHYSFSKGSSTQSYPSSVMGVIALLRQTYLDAAWYKTAPATEGRNLTLQAWNEQQTLPQIFEANDKWNALRADRIGDEAGVQYIIKGGGNEYQRLAEMKATGATFILPLTFPQAQDVEDPADARFVSVADMKHWELAPANPAQFEKRGIPFCLTAADLKDMKEFLPNLRKAIAYGLSEATALNALTKVPATVLGVYNEAGSLDAGKWANFFIASGPIFQDKTTIYQNWIQGKKYTVKEDSWADPSGAYQVVFNTGSGPVNYTLNVKGGNAASLVAGKDTVTSKFYYDGRSVRINVAPERSADNLYRLSGTVGGEGWTGYGEDSVGNRFTWTATAAAPVPTKADSARRKAPGELGKILYPFVSFGWEENAAPEMETILVRNATVWTNEKEGVLQNSDVLLRNGKIAAVGKNLPQSGAKVIDGTGKHLTAGIIDEHSHIAAASINEGGQSVTSEVRIADNLNPDDINIYRQLSGGVTTSHILHGSANTIGGQTQLIKLRWGANDEGLKFKGADPFIKFALGENVKRTGATQNNRFPDTRMGVEQVLTDAFTRAKDYERTWQQYEKGKSAKGTAAPRRDLELDALVEILNEKRFITCHSYVQSEINAALKVADKLGFKFNTLTHILEGYKVADKMKAHGAAASTFSDWWNYKIEVIDAIPYNASIMQRVGLNVAINSDDAEMARRLNQEAAKSVKYGGMSEEDALKMVTLNPAKMLHIDRQVGSIKVGKDADVVLWSDAPLSIYAKPMYTIVDGTIYFDREKDAAMRRAVALERQRLVKKMLGEKRSGAAVTPALPSYQLMHTCSDHAHSHGLLTIDAAEVE